MTLIYWIAFGIGSQVVTVPLALAIGGITFWIHFRSTEEKSGSAFLVPCFLALAAGLWVTAKGLVALSYLDASSSERVIASLDANRTSIQSASLHYAVLPSFIFGAAAFLFFFFKRRLARWLLAVALFASMCVYLGFLDSRLAYERNNRTRASNVASPTGQSSKWLPMIDDHRTFARTNTTGQV